MPAPTFDHPLNVVLELHAPHAFVICSGRASIPRSLLVPRWGEPKETEKLLLCETRREIGCNSVDHFIKKDLLLFENLFDALLNRVLAGIRVNVDLIGLSHSVRARFRLAFDGRGSPAI